MRRIHSSFALLFCVLVPACVHGPGPTETLPQLKNAIGTDVSTAEQNAQNSALVEQVSNDKHLQGLTRAEVEDKLGRGDLCSRHPICGERGFDGNDWYYEVGREGSSYVRQRPALIVGFSRFGKVERTFVLRAQEQSHAADAERLATR